jgi:hypothetical protein
MIVSPALHLLLLLPLPPLLLLLLPLFLLHCLPQDVPRLCCPLVVCSQQYAPQALPPVADQPNAAEFVLQAVAG